MTCYTLQVKYNEIPQFTLAKCLIIAHSLAQLIFFWQRTLGAYLSWASVREQYKSFHFPCLLPVPNMLLQYSLFGLFGCPLPHGE